MQQTTNKTIDSEFHAMEYMRQIREKFSAQYQTDRQKYLKRAKEAMEAFKCGEGNNNHSA